MASNFDTRGVSVHFHVDVAGMIHQLVPLIPSELSVHVYRPLPPVTTVLPEPRSAFTMQSCATCSHPRKHHYQDGPCGGNDGLGGCGCEAMTRLLGAPPDERTWAAAGDTLIRLLGELT